MIDCCKWNMRKLGDLKFNIATLNMSVEHVQLVPPSTLILASGVVMQPSMDVPAGCRWLILMLAGTCGHISEQVWYLCTSAAWDSGTATAALPCSQQLGACWQTKWGWGK